MFNSGFAETLPIGLPTGIEQESDGAMAYAVEDSDAEDQDDSSSTLEDDNDLDFDEPQTGLVIVEEDDPVTPVVQRAPLDRNAAEHGELDPDTEGARNVRSKLSHPSSPRSRTPRLAQERDKLTLPSIPGPRKMQVVVRDASYTTYLAVLYYVSPM